MIDIHQHLMFGVDILDEKIAPSLEFAAGRIVRHARRNGIRRVWLLEVTTRPCTDWVIEAARLHPDIIIPFACIDPRTEAQPARLLEEYRRRGFAGAAELKAEVPVDHPGNLEIYKAAGALGMPVIIHFQERVYNTGFENFERIVERFRDTNFIGHAQTWWANISADGRGRADYPKGPVHPGGLTDRWLSQFPNLFADLSAGSGNNALARDPEFAKDFVSRQRHKLLFGSDCPCLDGAGEGQEGRCFAQMTLSLLRTLAAPDAFDDIAGGNALALLKGVGR